MSIGRRLVRRARPTLLRVLGLDMQIWEIEQGVARVKSQLVSLESAGRDASELRQRVEALDAAMPTVLNAISSQGGVIRSHRRDVNALNERMDSYGAQLGEMWNRLEMIRRETLFELRYGADSIERTGAPERVEPRVIDPEKLKAAAEKGLRLNLGAGHVPIDGYVNVDMRELPGIDIVAALGDLPVAPSSVAEIFSSHVLEHFPHEQLDRQMLPYWISLLAPRGVFRAIVPDGGAMLASYAAGGTSYSDLREVLYGGQEYEGDFHFDLFTTDTLRVSLETAGLVEVEVEAEGRVNGLCLEFQIVARKPT